MKNQLWLAWHKTDRKALFQWKSASRESIGGLATTIIQRSIAAGEFSEN